ncbi:MAG: hypothetical protein GY756_05390 [bacterium]|nr:hypothetical protein [bacterium]
MIKTINHKGLRNGEHIQFSSDIKTVLSDEDLETLGIKPQTDKYSLAVEAMPAFYNLQRKSMFSDILENLDDERDDGISGINKVIGGYIIHFDSDKKAAALLLKSKISSYGPNIGKMNYHTETVTINSICNAVKTDSALKAAAELLGLTEWFDFLDSKNSEFNNYHMQRVKEATELPDEKVAELRKETTTHYNELVKHIEAHITLKGIEDYKQLADGFNALIDEYNLIVNRRSSSNDESNEEE